MTPATSTAWDVVIAGSGPAGSVAAGVLARAGRRVLMVDPVPPPERKIGESLPGAARPLLDRLGLLWALEETDPLPCYGNTSAWGTSERFTLDAIRDPHGPGWHLDRPRFDAALRAAACDRGACSLAARIRAATFEGEDWALQLDGGAIRARLLIDATGRRAELARRQGCRRHRDDDLVAVYAWVKPAADDRDMRTLIESSARGWWYTALLPDRSRVVSLHVGAADAQRVLRSGAFPAWVDETVHVRQLLAGSTPLTAPRATDAAGARLDRFTGPGWLAAGDAACAFDPLSSQGIYNALYAGMRGGEAAHEHLAGDAAALERYAARLEQIRAAYLRGHRAFYAAERRWPESAFWRLRAAVARAAV